MVARGLPTLTPRLLDVDGLFDQFFGAGRAVSAPWHMPVSLWEGGEHTHLELELPGVSKDNLEIVVQDGKLNVAAERKTPEGVIRYMHNERHYGRVERTFSLPKEIDTESIKADLTDGLLRLAFSKRPEAQPKRVEIQTR